MEQSNLPEWYKSSTDAQTLSATLKSLAGLLIPVLKNLFGFDLGTETTDSIIDAILILGFGAWAAWGYYRSKSVMGARLEELRGQIRDLGGSPQV